VHYLSNLVKIKELLHQANRLRRFFNKPATWSEQQLRVFTLSSSAVMNPPPPSPPCNDLPVTAASGGAAGAAPGREAGSAGSPGIET
jgi:hypothetical protein